MSVVVTDEPARRRGSWIAFIVVALIILAALAAWAWYASRPRPARVVQRDIVGYVALNGSIVVPPSARGDVYAPFQAPVDKVEGSVGEKVSRGDVLVTLSVPSVQTTVDQALANLRAAETAYANARRQYGAQAATTQQQATSPGTDQQAAQWQAQAAQADLQSNLAPYLQQLAAAREAYQQAKAGARGLALRAPVSGTVLALNAAPGQTLDPRQKNPVITVVDLRALQAEAEMSPDQAAYVKVDMPVVVSFKEIPGKQFDGKVTRITTRVDSHLGGLVNQQRYVALVDFRNTDDMAKPGMTPMVAIKTGEARNALAVPADAIHQDSSGRPTVEVLRGGRWTQVAVQPGLSDGQYTQVKSGVQRDEVVQVTPNPLSAASLPHRP